MKLVVFGLSVTSAWGNGHATLWRGLIRALARRGHRVIFFERDQPYYAAHRDLVELPGTEIVLYEDEEELRALGPRRLADADAAFVTSYCPDAHLATELVLEAPAEVKVYYDLDAPVTLAKLAAGLEVPYIPPGGLGAFDLVLSYAGGPTLEGLRLRLGAREARALYGSADPEIHRPVPPDPTYCADLSYLGTYSRDRQQALEELFLAPARQRPEYRFLIGGSQYPEDFPWTPNTYYVFHVPPADHPAFYASSALTVNLTRGPMAEVGWCPSGRIFEAAACAAPILTDVWPGLEGFFTPGEEILVARDAGDTLDALSMPREALARIGRAARERVLAEHTADVRARELEALLEEVRVPRVRRAVGGEP